MPVTAELRLTASLVVAEVLLEISVGIVAVIALVDDVVVMFCDDELSVDRELDNVN
jgi:hypothetical protein